MRVSLFHSSAAAVVANVAHDDHQNEDSLIQTAIRLRTVKCRLRDTNLPKKKLKANPNSSINETNYEYNNLFSIFSE